MYYIELVRYMYLKSIRFLLVFLILDAVGVVLIVLPIELLYVSLPVVCG